MTTSTTPGTRHRPSNDHEFYDHHRTARELIARLVSEAKAIAARMGQ